MDNNKSVIVLGAGLSGLSAAFYLDKKGFDVKVIEKNNRIGGALFSEEIEGFQLDNGANTVIMQHPEFYQLMDDLELTHEIIWAKQEANRRFIQRNGKLHEVPSSFWTFLQSDLLTFSGKIRILASIFKSSFKGKNVSASDFITHHLGEEADNYLFNPFLTGVYAGNTEKLSFKHIFPDVYRLEQEHGSLFKSFKHLAKERKAKGWKRSTIFRLDKGIQSIPNKIKSILGDKILLGEEIKSIKKDKTAKYHVSLSSMLTIEADIIINTIPTHQWQSFDSFLPKINLEYAPISLVHLGFGESAKHIFPNGFGFLIPSKEKSNILGCILNSAMFDNITPKGQFLCTVFYGGANHSDKINHSEEKILEEVLESLQKLFPNLPQPIFTNINKWKKGIPQYNIGHESVLEQFEELEKQNSNFYCIGNYRNGVSVSQAVYAGVSIANKIAPN